jgi:hypothetical protein
VSFGATGSNQETAFIGRTGAIGFAGRQALLGPGFYAHPGLGLLKEPVLEAQAVFQLPQSASPPGAKNAEIVRALFEESGQPAHHPDAVTADLLAYVKRTQARGHGDDRLSGL